MNRFRTGAAALDVAALAVASSFARSAGTLPGLRDRDWSEPMPPASPGACATGIQCYYVPVSSNTEYLEGGVLWASR